MPKGNLTSSVQCSAVQCSAVQCMRVGRRGKPLITRLVSPEGALPYDEFAKCARTGQPAMSSEISHPAAHHSHSHRQSDPKEEWTASDGPGAPVAHLSLQSLPGAHSPAAGNVMAEHIQPCHCQAS
jgi:hypothetical protein